MNNTFEDLLKELEDDYEIPKTTSIKASQNHEKSDIDNLFEELKGISKGVRVLGC